MSLRVPLSLHQLRLKRFRSYSQSGLRARMVWFVAPWQVEDTKGKTRVVDADAIRKRFGLFDKISHQPAKLGARCVEIRCSVSCAATDPGELAGTAKALRRRMRLRCAPVSPRYPARTKLTLDLAGPALSPDRSDSRHRREGREGRRDDESHGRGGDDVARVRPLFLGGRVCSDKRATQQASRSGVAGIAGERLPTRPGRRAADGRPVPPRRIE